MECWAVACEDETTKSHAVEWPDTTARIGPREGLLVTDS